MSDVLSWLALLAYGLGSGWSLAFLVAQRPAHQRWGLGLLWVGLGLHSLALATAWWFQGGPPVVGVGQSLLVMAWALMLAGLTINLRLEVKVLGAFVGPLAAAMVAVGLWLPAGAPPPPALKSAWLVLHVLAVMIGYGLLLLTGLSGALYLWQDRALRQRRLEGLFRRLPSLRRLDELGRQTLLAGFLGMTVGLITGSVFAQLTLGSYWRWDPKEVWALITWFLFAALIHGRFMRGWMGRKGAWLSLLAVATLCFTFLGAGILFPGYHTFEALATFGEVHP